MSCFYSIENKKIRETVKKDGMAVLELNIEYPCFKVAHVQEREIKVINDFYKDISESFKAYCIKKSESISLSENNNERKTAGETMKFHISYYDSEYISSVCDVIHFDGFFKYTQRICHTWEISGMRLLPHTYFMKLNNESKKSVRQKVFTIISEQIEKGGCIFSYDKKRFKRYAPYINPKNYFLCEKGIAFWFEKGTIAPEPEGYPTFILPLKIKKELP